MNALTAALMSFSQPIAVTEDLIMECSDCARAGTVRVGVNEKEKFELRILEVNKMKGKPFVLFIPATSETILYFGNPNEKDRT